MPDLPEPVPAATLVLMREPRRGPPELLVMERTGSMVFAPGALVFPGGRIDAGDHEIAVRHGALPDGAARVAAVRETIEETGIAPAITPGPDPETIARLRSAILRDLPLDRLLADKGLSLDLAALTPFARWCPNFRETRRFDTIFFLTEAPPGAAEPNVSSDEAVRAFWASAADILTEIDKGKAHAIFPTRRNLERLARFGSIAEARADAARHPVRKITPWIEERGGRRLVCIPEDAGYPVTSEPIETARRR